MEEFESVPATKEKNLRSRLAALEESVESNIEALFAGYEPPKASAIKLNKINQSNREVQIKRQQAQRRKESDELILRIETGAQVAASLKLKAEQQEHEAAAIDPIGQFLNTTTLPPLSGSQAQQVTKILEANPSIVVEKHITVETATALGFEGLPLKELAPIAAALKHPFFKKGKPDFQKLTDPTEQFFLATLSSLVLAYDHGDLIFPEARFVDLPRTEMKVLHNLFLAILQQSHPYVNPDSQYKGSDLRRIAEKMLREANQVREREGSTLFGKVFPNGDGFAILT